MGRVERACLTLGGQKVQKRKEDRILFTPSAWTWLPSYWVLAHFKLSPLSSLTRFSPLLDSRITSDGDCSHEIKRCLLLQRKAMTNLDSILKSKDITLPTKVHLVKAMVFPVVMYGCESWTIKKVECRRMMLLNCGVGEDSWESLGFQGDPTSQS